MGSHGRSEQLTMKTSPDETQTMIEGFLEVNHSRGVVYFHAAAAEVKAGAVPTPLRIQGLGQIPGMAGHQIDARVDRVSPEANMQEQPVELASAAQIRARRTLADVDPAIHRSIPPSPRAYHRYGDDGGAHLYEDE